MSTGNFIIDLAAGALLLINGIMGCFGRILPFRGKENYTEESVRKMSHIMAAPQLIAGGVCTYVFCISFFGKNDGMGWFMISIFVLLADLIIHIAVNKKVLKSIYQ